MEGEDDVIKAFKGHLDDWDFISAGEFLKQKNLWIKQNAAFELMPLVINYITEEIYSSGPHMVKGCSELLKDLSRIGAPKECLIALIEHCEPFENSIKFSHVLPALGVTMEKLYEDEGSRRKLALTWNWTLETVVSHLHALSLPVFEDSISNSEERLLLDSNPKIISINGILQDFVDFVDILIHQVVQDWSPDLEKQRMKCKDYLVRSVMAVIAKPVSSMNVERYLREKIEIKSSTREIVDGMVRLLIKIQPNLLVLPDYEANKDRFIDPEYLDKDENSLEKNWNLAIATLFTVIFDDCEVVDKSLYMGFIKSLPSCYSHIYVFNALLPSILQILEGHTCLLLVIKGLDLSWNLVKRIPEESLEGNILDMKIHADFLKSLVGLMVYNDNSDVRQQSFKIFDRYFSTFNEENGRYRLINIIIVMANHSGIIGYAISKIKDCTLNQIKKEKSQFKGHDLRVLVKQFIKLKNGAETDLLEVSDEIMSAINCLICIFIRDRLNDTGIWDLKDDIQKNFVDLIRTGLKMSKAHYKHKLEEKPEKEGVDVDLRVGAELVPTMTPQKKKEFIEAALNTFGMMECVLIQLQDVLNK